MCLYKKVDKKQLNPTSVQCSGYLSTHRAHPCLCAGKPPLWFQKSNFWKNHLRPSEVTEVKGGHMVKLEGFEAEVSLKVEKSFKI